MITELMGVNWIDLEIGWAEVIANYQSELLLYLCQHCLYQKICHP